jgi:hypothetical protein
MTNEQKDAVLKILSETGSTFTEAAEKIRNILEPGNKMLDSEPDACLYVVEALHFGCYWNRVDDAGKSAFCWGDAVMFYMRRVRLMPDRMHRIVRYSNPEIVWPEK